jgi:hypothetical protein
VTAITGHLIEAVKNKFRGGYWTYEEIERAAKSITPADLELGWRWTVGTRGSTHHVEGWAPTQEAAETRSGEVFAHALSRNPAVGSLDNHVQQETPRERFARLSNKIAAALNE